MVKYFCDGCGAEIPKTANRGRFFLDKRKSNGGILVKLAVEVMVSVDGAANAGHVCVDCIMSTVAEGNFKGPTP